MNSVKLVCRADRYVPNGGKHAEPTIASQVCVVTLTPEDFTRLKLLEAAVNLAEGAFFEEGGRHRIEIAYPTDACPFAHRCEWYDADTAPVATEGDDSFMRLPDGLTFAPATAPEVDTMTLIVAPEGVCWQAEFNYDQWYELAETTWLPWVAVEALRAGDLSCLQEAEVAETEEAR